LSANIFELYGIRKWKRFYQKVSIPFRHFIKNITRTSNTRLSRMHVQMEMFINKKVSTRYYYFHTPEQVACFNYAQGILPSVILIFPTLGQYFIKINWQG
jgi:hypothetical protein